MSGGVIRIDKDAELVRFVAARWPAKTCNKGVRP
jgi:hypothetical protein